MALWLRARAWRRRSAGCDAGPFARFAAGAIVVTLAISLPWVGWIAQIAVVVFGLGGLAVERKLAYRPPIPAHA